MDLQDRITRIEDRERIADTLTRYAHGLDLPDREIFGSVWTDDAVYRVDAPFGEVRGTDAILAAWDTFQTIFVHMRHYTINVLIDGPDGDAATARSFAFVTGTDAEGTGWTAACIYHDTLRKVGEDWLLSERYDQVDYMVPWLSPMSLDESSRFYVDPEAIQRLIAAGQTLKAQTVP